MKLWSILMLISFVAMVMVGFISMGEMISHSESGCIASALNGVSCVSSSTDLVIQHIKAYQSFLAITVGSLLGFVALMIGLLVYKSWFTIWYRRDPHKHVLYNPIPFCYSGSISEKLRKISWLSLLENSPSF